MNVGPRRCRPAAWLVPWVFVACSAAEPAPPLADEAVPFVTTLAETLRETPTDYADPAHWACLGAAEPGVCAGPFPMAAILTDGTVDLRPWTPDPAPALDCFYIYPTMNWSPGIGNHMDLGRVDLQAGVVRTQAAPFSEVCRVYAPYYRQAILGTYLAGDQPAAVDAFRLAFLDVAAAFEHYLAHWNEGRPLVILGHSQGAQMASYLLHLYFDGEAGPILQDGRRHEPDPLRERLVVAMPIGFNVYTRSGESVGGSFAELPLCREPGQTGCVIHYRSYPEGFVGIAGSADGAADRALAADGWLHEPFDEGRHRLACVNPATGRLQAGERILNPLRGTRLDPEPDSGVLEGTWLWGPFNNMQSAWQTDPGEQWFPRRYTATCRGGNLSGGWLAIGLLEGAVPDDRGDPVAAGLAAGGLGLHVHDFSLAAGDLVAQIRRRAAAWEVP